MLAPLTFRPLPLGSIRPQGWMQTQLRIQAEGLSGHLHEFWPDVKDSGWFGGDAEGWERAPYWLDGVIPLAAALGDPRLMEVAGRYVGFILDHVKDDGQIAPMKHRPREDLDVWSVFLVCKALTQWHEATGEPRVVPTLLRGMRALGAQLQAHPLRDWGRSRWAELVLTLHWLHDRTGEAWLLDVARLAAAQGYDWRSHFAAFHFPGRLTAGFGQHTHVVNNAMGVKAPAVWFRQSRDPADRAGVYTALEMLDRYHGQATGVFSGDEHYAGRNPSQGTETCAVVEYLFSLECALAILGDPAFGDRIERIGYNALPAPFDPAMWVRQYDQQANQVLCRRHEDRVFTTNGDTANCFGVETHYGCCTANMHQGWPKLAAHLWMGTADGGLAAVAHGPSRVETTLGGASVTVESVTDYPFGETVALVVRTDRETEFPLLVRVPAWADGAIVDGRPAVPGGFHRVQRAWKGEMRVEAVFPMKARLERRFNRAAAIHRGPLVFSLPIGDSWRPYAPGWAGHPDCEVFPTTPWNYALDVSEATLAKDVAFQSTGAAGAPFSVAGARISATVRGRRLPQWVLTRHAADVPPASPVTTDQPEETLTLVPYGCPNLRITEFPTLRD